MIGDLHEPFCLDGYLEFCKQQYEVHNCNKVVFIGDIIDNHYSSYHETDSDGLGGKTELDKLKQSHAELIEKAEEIKQQINKLK